MRIIVFDDMPSHAYEMVNRLIEIGHMRSDVTVVHSSQEAIDLLEHNETFDLGIFDILLENEEKNEFGYVRSGFDIAKEFKKKMDIPIIFSTSYSLDENYVKMLKVAGFSVSSFKDKRQLTENRAFLESTIEEAIDEHEYIVPEPSHLEYYLYSSRKVGIYVSKKGEREYKFFGKDEIMFFRGNGDCTDIYFDESLPDWNSKCVTVSGNLGNIAGTIAKVYFNIVKIDNSHYINLEQIDRIVGTTLYFSSGDHIKLTARGKKYLSQHGLLIKAKNNSTPFS